MDRKSEIAAARVKVSAIYKEIKPTEIPKAVTTLDWGSTRGQGKRVGYMVKGSMGAGGLSGSTKYYGLDISKYYDEKYKDDFRHMLRTPSSEIFHYYDGREYGLNHIEALTYAKLKHFGKLK